MKKYSILMVDDEEAWLVDIRDYFKEYNLKAMSDPIEALRELQNQPADILIVDYRMPKMNGLQFLVEAGMLKSYHYGILLSAFADKIILKEMLNKDMIKRVFDKPIRLVELKKEIDNLLEELVKEDLLQKKDTLIIGLNKGLRQPYETVKRLAPHPVTICIYGETGTGKEEFARLIHELSPRRRKAFISLNMSSLTESLVTSELFGTVKSACNNAIDKPGWIEMANGGTLFLDEISETKHDLQIMLLQVLEDRTVTRVGGRDKKKIDFRLIVATNKKLEDCVKDNRIRSDFFHRITQTVINLPPLRERTEDIPKLVDFFIEKVCKDNSLERLQVDDSVYEILKRYPWPGNVRELLNTITRVVFNMQEESSIKSTDFAFLDSPTPIHDSEASSSNKSGNLNKAFELILQEIIHKNIRFENVKKLLLTSILNHFGGKVSRASEMTGIPPCTFYRNRIKVLFLSSDDSCYNYMAAGWANIEIRDTVEPLTASIRAHNLNTFAVKVMSEVKINIADYALMLISDFTDKKIDYVVTFGTRVNDIHKCFNHSVKCKHYEVPTILCSNSNEEDYLSEYRKIRDTLREIILKLPDDLPWN
ncbi:MAG: sigma 54-interacting transcriptional regulator [Chitinivibrionales bacterium]|nr:sigma 54-interacting transcriptional regulator [Chitinivibrionales bacterium]